MPGSLRNGCGKIHSTLFLRRPLPPRSPFFETDLPIVYASDVTYALLNNYYPEFTNLFARSVRNGNLIEEHAIRRSEAVLFSSDWAARSAIDDYGADPSKVHVLPFGANLDQVPGRSVVLEHEQSGTCKLLFLAVSWERKGGEIARETLVDLIRLGIDAKLYGVRLRPAAGPGP